jgi:Zn-dependent protease with chaperone function
MLITLMGGTMLLACGWWPAARDRGSSALSLEGITWRRVWLAVAPALAVAAWLCGWALTEPDPVPERVPISLVLMTAPIAVLLARAVVRAGWSVIVEQEDPATATVGLLRRWIVFSPHLARQLDEGQINAVLEHERAHARHWDPLRIWLAQLAADLQWPWPQAHERLRRWLLALELARDEEARATGIEGTDLANAILASARFDQRVNLPPQAALTGEASALKQRIGRLLDPLPTDWVETQMSTHGPLLTLLATLLLALVLGLMFGERVVRALFWIAA